MSDTATQATVTFAPFFTEAKYTGYGLAKVVNDVLTLAELKTIPPQMVYNYGRKGLINGQKDAKAFTKAEAIAWADKYLGKRAQA
jgi:hypothetical protein